MATESWKEDKTKCSINSDCLANACGFLQGESETIGITEHLHLEFNGHVDTYISKVGVIIFFQLLAFSHILQLAEGHHHPSRLPSLNPGLTFDSFLFF